MPDKIKPGSKAASIRAKRRASGVDRVAKKAKAGEPHAERAYVQMGKRNTKIITGQEDLSEWDDEELRRGQRRDRNGRFQGAPPKVVPKAVHDELVKRTLSKAQQIMHDSLEDAVTMLKDIATNPLVEEKDRLRAINMIMDRVMGKPQEKIEVKSDTPPWQVAIQAGIVSIKPSDLGGSDEDEDTEEDTE